MRGTRHSSGFGCSSPGVARIEVLLEEKTNEAASAGGTGACKEENIEGQLLRLQDAEAEAGEVHEDVMTEASCMGELPPLEKLEPTFNETLQVR